MTTTTKAPSIIETRWMPAVLAVLSETAGQTKTAIARRLDLGRSVSVSVENVWRALVALEARGYVERTDGRIAHGLPAVVWVLTPAGARHRGGRRTKGAPAPRLCRDCSTRPPWSDRARFCMRCRAERQRGRVRDWSADHPTYWQVARAAAAAGREPGRGQ